MAYDSDRHVVVMFGGTYTDDDIFYLSDTQEWDGKSWTLRFANPRPPAQSNHVMAYDAHRHVTVLYGKGEETWEWDGQTWTQRGAFGPDRPQAAMVYDPVRQACILFGGHDGNGFSNETWAWDGAEWTKLDTPVSPPGRVDHGMAYDSDRQTLVLFGGKGADGPLKDTWEFPCGPPCYPDRDGSGVLDLFDFLDYINLFNAGDLAADCDASGALDFFDFLCFNNAFNAGC